MKKPFPKWILWILIAAGFLVFVHILYSIPAPFKWMESVWSAGDLVAFVGMIALGCITFYQTKRANETSERLMRLEEIKYKFDERPFVMVAAWSLFFCEECDVFEPGLMSIQIQPFEDNESLMGLGISLQNTTDAVLSASFCAGQVDTEKWRNAKACPHGRKLFIKSGEEKEVLFYASADYMKSMEGKKVELSFYLDNRFGECYKESFKLVFIRIPSKENRHQDGYLEAQEYKIEKISSVIETNVDSEEA